MRKLSAETEFSKIVPLRRIHEYHPPKKRKYHKIREVTKKINALILLGNMVNIYYNIKHDELLYDVYAVGKAKLNKEYTLFITTLLNRRYNEREMRKLLDEIITYKGYDRIRFD